GLLFASNDNETDQRRFHGESLSLQFLIGAHAGKHAEIGFAYLRDEIFDLRSSDSLLDGDEPDAEHLKFFTSTIAFFADVRLSNQPEVHFQGFVGPGSLVVDGRRNAGNLELEDPSGLIFALVATGEYRLAPRVTVGVGLRLTFAPLSVTETSNEVDV